MSGKNSFVLYFDMYPSIRDLPDDQRGALFSALFEFAELTVRQPACGQNLTQILEQHPELGEAAKMAFSFITKTLERDTEKWREKQQRYSRAAEKRWGERLQEGGGAQKGETAPTVKGRSGGNAWDYV